jgi:hypothetical protein
LDGKAGDHDVVAYSGIFVLVRSRRRKTAACSLKEQGGDVAGDEDAWVREGFYAGIFRAKGGYDAGEAEVDSSGEEGGSDC